MPVLNRIKIERAELNLTQEDVAKRIGVSRQPINSIEKKPICPFYHFSIEAIRSI